MAFDRVRFQAVQDFLKFYQRGIWSEFPPSSLLTRQDRSFYTQLYTGMVRHHRWLESEIEGRLSKPLRKLPLAVRGILMLGAYQLLLMDRVPARAAIYETVQLVKPYKVFGQKSLVNAILRRLQRETPSLESSSASLAVKTSHSDWMVARWQERFGDERTTEICFANNEFSGLTLRPELPWTAATLQSALLAEGFEAEAHPAVPEALLVAQSAGLAETTVFREGSFYIQDGSSQLFLQLTKPLWQGRVLDACAAPGGKALGIQQCPQVSQLIACDNAAHRVKQIRQNSARLKRDPLFLVLANGQSLPVSQPFDRILLDVPCSSTGTLRKNPHLKWKQSTDHLLDKLDVQIQLMDEAAQWLVPRGLIVYATCSIEPEENELRVESFLEQHPNFNLVPFAELTTIPNAVMPFITPEGTFQILPNRELMGFYAAVLRREAD